MQSSFLRCSEWWAHSECYQWIRNHMLYLTCAYSSILFPNGHLDLLSRHVRHVPGLNLCVRLIQFARTLSTNPLGHDVDSGNDPMTRCYLALFSDRFWNALAQAYTKSCRKALATFQSPWPSAHNLKIVLVYSLYCMDVNSNTIVKSCPPSDGISRTSIITFNVNIIFRSKLLLWRITILETTVTNIFSCNYYYVLVRVTRWYQLTLLTWINLVCAIITSQNLCNLCSQHKKYMVGNNTLWVSFHEPYHCDSNS